VEEPCQKAGNTAPRAGKPPHTNKSVKEHEEAITTKKFLLDSDLGIPDPGRALVLLGGDGDLVGILDGGGGDSWDEKNLKYFLHEW
jgi:hypothetical protein